MKHSALLIGVIAAWALLVACIPVGQQVQVEVTPGVVPEEVRGARWRELPVSYCIVPSDAGFVSHERFVALVDEAFAAWGLGAKNEGACTAVEHGNRRNEIGWGNAPEQGQPFVHEAGFTRLLFQTCVTFCPGGSDPRIVEADITIDTDAPRGQRSEACLRTTLLHETGHFFGLHHLPEPAVMAAALTNCRAEITSADRAALDSLYGRAGD